PTQPGALGEVACAVSIEFADAPSPSAPGATSEVSQGPSSRVSLDGRDVSQEIRTPEVSAAASVVAADPAVREALVAKQRELIARGDWVAEGRDIGTVVAPDASLKIFLTADSRERARRRADELGADVDMVLAEQVMRDERDIGREHSPLRAAADAVTVDTTGLTVEQVVRTIVDLDTTRALQARAHAG
ncbi:MAG TPA: (d)CMP kinase, partial [Solirubrobacteraceae bacterium]|nr:(d)CMP kinase [Solirubrobacteraceae bacterium]